MEWNKQVLLEHGDNEPILNSLPKIAMSVGINDPVAKKII